MPELPEAEVATQQIRARLLGATLTETWIGRADIVREGYRHRAWYLGSELCSVERFGKSVALGFAKDHQIRYVVAELGMTGLLLFPSAQPKYPQHIHVEMTFAGGRESALRYWNPRRFGRLSLLDQKGLNGYLARRFGCDPLTVSRKDFHRLIKARRGRLKPLLSRPASECTGQPPFGRKDRASLPDDAGGVAGGHCLRWLERAGLLRAGWNRRAVQAATSRLWEGRTALSKSMRPSHSTTSERTKLIFLSSLSGAKANIEHTRSNEVAVEPR
jgi:hypothetical protein